MQGIRAVASIHIAHGREELDLESIKKHARNQDVESVIITRLIGIEKESEYVFEDNYVYWAEYEIVNLETKLYDVRSDRLIWSAASESFDPQTVEEVVRSLSTQIVESLSENGLISQ